MKKAFLAIMATTLVASLGLPALQAKDLVLEPQKVSVITSPTDNRDVRTLVYFEMPNQHGGAKLEFDNAFLIFRGKVTDADFGMIEVFPITREWGTAGSASWSLPWERPGGDFSGDVARASTTLKSADGEDEVRLNVTFIVKAWLDGVLPNNGIVILGSRADLDNSSAKFDLKGEGVKLKIVY